MKNKTDISNLANLSEELPDGYLDEVFAQHPLITIIFLVSCLMGALALAMLFFF